MARDFFLLFRKDGNFQIQGHFKGGHIHITVTQAVEIVNLTKYIEDGGHGGQYFVYIISFEASTTSSSGHGYDVTISSHCTSIPA